MSGQVNFPGPSQHSSSEDSLNSALDELGLLSSVTNSRQQYLQENEQFYGRLASLTMADSEPGPSRVLNMVDLVPCNDPPAVPLGDVIPLEDYVHHFLGRDASAASNSMLHQTGGSYGGQPEMMCQQQPPQPCGVVSRPSQFSFNFSAPRAPSNAEESKSNSNSGGGTEKENNLFTGFKVLTMNSKFISSFRSDYNLPSHVAGSSNYQCPLVNTTQMDRFLHKYGKRNFFRRKRLRTHPYESCNSSYHTMFMYSSSDSSIRPSNASSGCYRSRTTSLSSGVCGKMRKRGSVLCKPHDLSFTTSGGPSCSSKALIVRSRSMENLSAALDREADVTASATAAAAMAANLFKAKDVENVSRAIQQMCVHDSG